MSREKYIVNYLNHQSTDFTRKENSLMLPGGLEPQTFQLTAQRANQLCHGDLFQVWINLSLSQLLYDNDYNSEPQIAKTILISKYKPIRNYWIQYEITESPGVLLDCQ